MVFVASLLDGPGADDKVSKRLLKNNMETRMARYKVMMY